MRISWKDTDWIPAMVIDNNGILWSGSDVKTIRGWEGPWDSGKCIALLNGHKDWVRALSITVENNLWSGSDDKTVMAWKASNGL